MPFEGTNRQGTDRRLDDASKQAETDAEQQQQTSAKVRAHPPHVFAPRHPTRADR